MSKSAANTPMSPIVTPNKPFRRRGPKPILTIELETQLVQWVLMQQSAGLRVSRADVISQAKEILRKDTTQAEEMKQSHRIGMGWCNRFIARHLAITLRPIVTEKIHDKTQPKLAIKTDAVKSKREETNKTAKPIKTRTFDRKHMEAAVEMYVAGNAMDQVKERFPLLHPRTIRRRVVRLQRGELDRRRGPRPLLDEKAEQGLVAWILSMQSHGIKVTKQDILVQANEQDQVVNGQKEGDNRLKVGWLRRFKERYPVLSGRARDGGQRELEDRSA